ncbi:hypothetical protein LAZ67_5002103 [Cordylochernes scorpioides]|uniref:Transposase n=1 Tax=Cordylochernes scorpioides TaxID=51811 RepID=A0ABY6KKW4_9ARAC|nr:hypothetical protein LAZ67_5002103 [Cordylochernes scorpioides]
MPLTGYRAIAKSGDLSKPFRPKRRKGLIACEDWLLNIHEEPNFLTKVITGDETWVYGYDPETKRQSSQWLLKNAPKPKKARMSKSKTKVLFGTFFDHQGIVHYEFLPQGQTINQYVYLAILRRLRESIRKKRPEKLKTGNAKPTHLMKIVYHVLQGTTCPILHCIETQVDLYTNNTSAPTEVAYFSGTEQNPGPPTKRQTTLTAPVHSGERESIDGELKMLILNMAAEIKSLGERIDIRLTKIETRMDDWDMRFCNMEEKLTKCTESQQATEKLASCNSLKVNELEARVEFFETRLREPNLVFYGIEREGDENQADCNLKIQNVIRDKMEIGDDLKITKCHRLSRGSNAPVLVVVPDYADRAKIFKNAYKLRDTKISISKDYSKNVREQRRILIAKRKELGERGIKSKLRDNKLFVNDKVCKVMNGQVVDSTGAAI